MGIHGALGIDYGSVTRKASTITIALSLWTLGYLYACILEINNATYSVHNSSYSWISIPHFFVFISLPYFSRLVSSLSHESNYLSSLPLQVSSFILPLMDYVLNISSFYFKYCYICMNSLGLYPQGQNNRYFYPVTRVLERQ